MLFGLTNAKATDQRAMTIIFHDFLHNLVELYVNDLVLKRKDRENHPYDLSKVFEKLRVHQPKVNPLKCAFLVTSGEFLHFIVQKERIEIDPDEVNTIIQMPPPRNLRESCGL